MSRRYFFGEWREAAGPLTQEDVKLLCEEGRRRAKALAEYPMDKILRLMAAVGKRWADPAYPPRKELEKELPGETGFSAEMIALSMREVAGTLDPEVLKKKIETELRGVPREGDVRYLPSTNTALSWSPLGVVLHVLSGNVFLVGLGSLVEGLLTANVTILKQSSGERRFLSKLIESFLECDEDGIVSRSIALIDYASSEHQVIAELKRQVDGVVVWGGEEAVRAYRNDLPARTRLVVFGPKLSIAVVTEAGLAHYGHGEVAERLAREMTIWDQNACTAPQLCFVEGERNARDLARALAEALDVQASHLPPGPADPDTATEIQKLRGVAEIAEARGEGMLLTSRHGVDWTVVVDRKSAIEPSPLHRTIRIVPVGSHETVLEEAERIRGYLQTVGLVALPEEGAGLARKLEGAGALRCFELGQMAGGEIDDPHDGAYDLPQLVHVNVTRLPLPKRDMRPKDILPRDAFRALLDERLRTLLDRARLSPFYARRLESVAIDTVDDLPKLPILTREEMDRNMSPRGGGLSTGEFFGGYVARSGGSTGEPKFSIYDGHDWEQMISHAVDVFRAAGLEKGDRVANCMLAGDLYGSFVSFDHINCRVGATTFAFAGLVDPQMFVKIWREYHVNVVQAIPAVLVPLLRAAKQIEPALTVPKVIYAGSPLHRSDYDWLVGTLGVERVTSIIGANDGGQLAFQCAHMSGALHHTVDDFNYIEIVDEKGERVPDGEPGRILITSLVKHAFPLIRYEIGDAGRIVPGPCACGRLGRRIEYLGRADDSLCIALLNVRYRDVVEALDGFPVSAVQLVAGNGDGGETLTVRVESDAGADSSDRMRTRCLEKMPKIGENLKNGALSRFDVEVHRLGSLPRNPRSGKIKQIVDERR